jgi:hypothetical protein
MTCRKARKLIPLLAGNDLPARKTGRTLAHIEHCPSCRKELREHSASLAKIKALADAGILKDWNKAEWTKLILKATSQKPEKRAFVLRLRPAAAWAVTSAVVLVMGAALFFKNADFRSVQISEISREQTIGKSGPPEGGLSRQGDGGQDVVSVTLVAQDSGLKVVWFFNKNFEWKEKGI